MHIVVTGAAGFVGSNLVRALNDRGESRIIAVDDLTQGDKFANIADCEIADYLDKDELSRLLAQGKLDGKVRAILHQGACSDTTESNGRFMMDVNYRYSIHLLEFCSAQRVPLIYASSAAVYGSNTHCRESGECEAPLNVYGYSKVLFDRYLRQRWEVAYWIRRLQPTVVLGHDPWKRYRLHPDHRHAGHLAVEGIVAARDPHFFPEQSLPHHRPEALLLFEADEPDHVEDVTGLAEAKLDALRCHESQLLSTMHIDEGAGPEAAAAQSLAFDHKIRTRLAEQGALEGVAEGEAFKLISVL